jgi:hypothetical protein
MQSNEAMTRAANRSKSVFFMLKPFNVMMQGKKRLRPDRCERAGYDCVY